MSRTCGGPHALRDWQSWQWSTLAGFQQLTLAGNRNIVSRTGGSYILNIYLDSYKPEISPARRRLARVGSLISRWRLLVARVVSGAWSISGGKYLCYTNTLAIIYVLFLLEI